MLLLNNQLIAKHVAGYHFLNPSLVFRTVFVSSCLCNSEGTCFG